MNKYINIFFAICMAICMFLFDIFWSSNQWLFMCISGIGICLSVISLLLNAQKLLKNQKK